MEKDSFGILILAFGDRGYHYAAYNLCLSIKHKNPNLKVAIFCDNNNHVDYKQCRADIIKVCDYFGAEPGLNKINALSDLPFTNTLYLDADGFCMKDLRPLIDDLLKQNRFFMCDIFGSGNFGEEISYDLWAKHEDSFDFFGVKKEDKWHTTQTSWIFCRAGKDMREFIKQVKHYWAKGFPKAKLKGKWGRFMPDELFFSGVISKNKIDASYSGKPIFYGNRYIENFGEITQNHYIMSLYGNGNGQRLTKLMYWEYYDRLMSAMCKEMGLTHIYKGHYLASAKITNVV